MTGIADAAWVRDLITRNRYLVLATSDGSRPWIAPVEYMVDDHLEFYFFSPADTLHAQHIANNARVAVSIFDRDQPDYTAGMTADLNGIQMECTAVKLDASDYTEAIVGAIDALEPPMPPYAVFKITPQRVYAPRIENGVNVRHEVDMGNTEGMTDSKAEDTTAAETIEEQQRRESAEAEDRRKSDHEAYETKRRQDSADAETRRQSARDSQGRP